MAEPGQKPQQLSAVERSRIAARRAKQQAAETQRVVSRPVNREKPNPFGTMVLASLGFFFLFLFPFIDRLLPDAFVDPLKRYLPHFPYFFPAVGFFLLAHSRGRSRVTYKVEANRNRAHPHYWKIPLLAGQGFILYVLGIYALGVGVSLWPPVSNLAVLLAFMVIGVGGYVLWYVAAYSLHRQPRTVGLRLSLLALTFALMALAAWVISQLVVVALILGFYALVTAGASIGLQPLGPPKAGEVEAQGGGLRAACLAATVFLLLPVALWAVPFGKPRLDLEGLGPAVQGIRGEILSQSYSPDGRRLAYVQKSGDRYYLGLVDAREPENSERLLLEAGEEPFRVEFGAGGARVVFDPMRSGRRTLWVADSATGDARPLVLDRVEALGYGPHYSAERGEFLHVVQGGAGFELRSVRLDGSGLRTLAVEPLLRSPAWTFRSRHAVFVGRRNSRPAIVALDPEKGEQDVVVTAEAPIVPSPYTEEGETLLKRLAPFLLKEGGEVPVITDVLPAPDGFRYLYLARRGGDTEIRSVLPDGTKDSLLYTTSSEIGEVSWHPDGQSVVFQERERRLGYLTKSHNVLVLDANKGDVKSLIPPQYPHRAPAVSPDGVKIAFAAESGLWRPTVGTMGIWVALLR